MYAANERVPSTYTRTGDENTSRRKRRFAANQSFDKKQPEQNGLLTRAREDDSLFNLRPKNVLKWLQIKL